jgi:hypothetical protein
LGCAPKKSALRHGGPKRSLSADFFANFIFGIATARGKMAARGNVGALADPPRSRGNADTSKSKPMSQPLKVFVHLAALVVWLELYRSQHLALFAALGALLVAWHVIKTSRRPLAPARKTLEISVDLFAVAALAFHIARPQSTLASVAFFGSACLAAFLSLFNQIQADRAEVVKQPT